VAVVVVATGLTVACAALPVVDCQGVNPAPGPAPGTRTLMGMELYEVMEAHGGLDGPGPLMVILSTCLLALGCLLLCCGHYRGAALIGVLATSGAALAGQSVGGTLTDAGQVWRITALREGYTCWVASQLVFLVGAGALALAAMMAAARPPVMTTRDPASVEHPGADEGD